MNEDLDERGHGLDADDRLIEAWLDRELSEEEHGALVQRASLDQDLGDRMHAARMVRSLFEGFPSETFPADRLELVLATARRKARREWLERCAAAATSFLRLDWKPALAMASLLAVTLTATLVSRPGSRRPVDPEVAAALEQVKWTLGFLSDVSRRTGETVRTNVLEPHLMRPMEQAVARVLDAPKPLN